MAHQKYRRKSLRPIEESSAGLKLALALGLLLLFLGCGEDEADVLGKNTAGRPVGLERSVPATFTVTPGVEHVIVTQAAPKTRLTLFDRQGKRLLGLVTDDHGQAMFAYIPDDYMIIETGNTEIPINQGRTLKRGAGYTIRNETVDPVEASEPFFVMGQEDRPSESLYDSQELIEGFNYIEVRDGTRIGVNVWFPDPILWFAQGPPWPTVVEYSGYSPSNPDNQEPGTMIANMLGYAVVGVNMRGTGCSGGVFDLFNPAQQADGYDIIEVVARQPWVLHNQVGMVGLSYSGITQLYVAATRPPGLAAITSLSVIEDPWRQQWPGGVYNQGFTREWLSERDRTSAPGGSSWVQKRIDEGDQVCEENQLIRTQNIDFQHFARSLEYYIPDVDDRRLGLLVKNIEVPVYLTGAWQDEQTGARFATMLDAFISTDRKKFMLFNGRHPDGYTPVSLSRWYEFLEFYVAKRIPQVPFWFRLFAPFVFEDTFGVSGLNFDRDRFATLDTYEMAIAAYEADLPVRLLFEFGAGHPVAGAPVARFEHRLSQWPPANPIPRQWYLGPDNLLSEASPDGEGIDRYQHDSEAGPVKYARSSSGSFIRPQIEYDWPPPAEGYCLSYLTEPLTENLVVAGNGGYVNLWFASDAQDANVEVTLTEIYPDDTEVIVQSGLFRVGHRHGLDLERSDEFQIEYTFRKEDFEPIIPGRFMEIKVPIRPFAHPFRAGSRIRLIVDTPGRDSPMWAYENPDYSGRAVYHQVARTRAMASYIKLPEIKGINVPGGYPPCPSLRGQICRDYVPVANLAAR